LRASKTPLPLTLAAPDEDKLPAAERPPTGEPSIVGNDEEMGNIAAPLK
jgi:hypothetical protein